MQQNKIFKYCLVDKGLNIDDIKSLNELKYTLINSKIIQNKYRKKIVFFDENELKNFVYTGVYEIKKFEGIADIFIGMLENNFIRIMKCIINSSYEAISILRIILYTLKNYKKYEGRFKFTLLEFKQKFDVKFKNNLYEISLSRDIDNFDKLDLIHFFKKII